MWRWSLGCRGRLPRRAHCLVSSPFWPILLSSWNQSSSGLPAALSPTAPAIRSASFFELGLNLRVGLGVLRPGRDPAEAQRPHQLAHAALPIADAETPLDQSAEIDQAPARHAVLCQLGAVLQATRQLALLLRVQPPLPARRLAVDQTRRSGGVEAVHPVTQGLPIHAGAAGRHSAACPLQDQRDRQQPASLFRRQRRLGQSPNLGRTMLRPYRHRHPRLRPQRGQPTHPST